ncbi:antirestriction protein ArdA [Enterococcus sp. AZ192]|uniref:antirestriction protein ArdA n=1 Tax=unclassified Enterococcus TaxID=2608891 RepID=UPI003D294DC3
MTQLVTEQMMMAHDGKRMGGKSDYWIYLTNLKAYNEGYLVGVYLHFPFSDEDLEQAYKQILVGNEFIDEFGCSYEEYFISDYDTPFQVSEYSFPQKLAEKYEGLGTYEDYPRSVIEVIAEHEGCRPSIFELDDNVMMSNDEKLGYVLVEEALITVPEHLRNYLDYEAMGRDYQLNTVSTFIDNYFIEFL